MDRKIAATHTPLDLPHFPVTNLSVTLQPAVVLWQVENPPHYSCGMVSRRLALAALALITLLGGGMRLWQARESLWLDELHTAWCATGPLAEVGSRAAIGNQSPLFFWLEWLLVQLLGPSELTLRLPSLIAGTLLGVALYVVCTRWTGQPWLGVLAAWLVAVSPRQIFFATEARPYAVIALLAVAHVALFLRVIERPTLLARTLWVAGGVLLFHLHYTAILLIPAEIAYSLLSRRSRHDAEKGPEIYRASSLSFDLFLTLAFCLPVLGHLQTIFSRRANWAQFVPQQPVSAILTTWPASLAGLLVLIDWLVRRGRRFRRLDGTSAANSSSQAPPGSVGPTEPTLAVLLWAIVPVALAWLATATDVARLLFPRYVIVSAPAATLLAVMAIRLAPWRSLQIVLGLGIALFALRTSGIVEQFQRDSQIIADRPDDWRSAVAYFNAQPGHDKHPVLVRTWLIEADGLRDEHDRALADYCLYPVTSLYPIDAQRERLIALPRTRSGHLAQDVREQIRASGGAWLVLGGRPEVADSIEANIVRGLGARGSGARGQRSEVRGQKAWRVAQSASFGNVRVVLIRLDK